MVVVVVVVVVFKCLLHMKNASPLQYIEAANLEEETRRINPVAYHEAWQELCKSE
jgi:CTP synthase